jgi:hypothetical protein
MTLQLNPMLPLWHVPTQQPCYAFAMLDYSQEHDLLFVVLRRDGEIWTVPNHELRAQINASLGRYAKASP